MIFWELTRAYSNGLCPGILVPVMVGGRAHYVGKLHKVNANAGLQQVNVEIMGNSGHYSSENVRLLLKIVYDKTEY